MANTKKQKINHFLQTDTKIYHRLLRYPIFPATQKFFKKGKKIVHKLSENGTVLAIIESATVEDFEKMVAIIYLLRQGRATRFDTSYTHPKKPDMKIDVSIVETKLSYMKDVLNCNSYMHIIESLMRLSNIKIIYDFVTSKGIHEKIIHMPIILIEFDEKNNISIHFSQKFLDLCLDPQKTLFLDLDTLCRLSPYGKNLYLFLLANLDKKEFLIETLLERSLISFEVEKKYHKQFLKRALDNLVKVSFIKKYTITNRTVKIVFSENKKYQAITEET